MAINADKIIRSFRFSVEILPREEGGGTQADKIDAGFQTVSGIGDETETIEYREGDDDDSISMYPGTLTYNEVTFEKGVTNQTNQDLLLDWRRACNNVANSRSGNEQNTGDAPENFRRDIKIKVNEEVNNQGVVKTLNNAWCSALEFSDLDAESSDVLIETFTVYHEGLEIDTPAM
jgi:phage tail-like protein